MLSLLLILPLLTFADKCTIGSKIWKNECNGTVDGLVIWNPHEECLSLGIGHFIWYPENDNQKFDAQFPQYLAFLKAKGMALPPFIDSLEFAPWNTREDFLSDERVPLIKKWLSETIDLQAEFLVERLHPTLDKIVQLSPSLKAKIDALSESPRGLFALIDYLNFKGEGLSPKERYQGKGWGLYQVLLGMQGNEVSHFQDSALARLTERVALAPKDESRWLPGWKNRIQRY